MDQIPHAARQYCIDLLGLRNCHLRLRDAGLSGSEWLHANYDLCWTALMAEAGSSRPPGLAARPDFGSRHTAVPWGLLESDRCHA